MKKTKKNNTTELVFIIDRSGSMSGFEADTIGGFNSTLEKQRELEGEVLVTTVLFNGQSVTIHDRLPIDKVAKMTDADYIPGGMTAMLDAVGSTINHIKMIHKYARPADVPAHTLFVITTDGLDNVSHKYSKTDIKKLIGEQTEKCGWEFIFLGANIDAVSAAEDIGIRRERAAQYQQSTEGIDACFSATSDFLCCMRADTLDSHDDRWKSKLERRK